MRASLAKGLAALAATTAVPAPEGSPHSALQRAVAAQGNCHGGPQRARDFYDFTILHGAIIWGRERVQPACPTALPESIC